MTTRVVLVVKLCPCMSFQIWPENIPEFDNIMKTFFHTCIELALRVFDVISIGLDLEVSIQEECT